MMSDQTPFPRANSQPSRILLPVFPYAKSIDLWSSFSKIVPYSYDYQPIANEYFHFGAILYLPQVDNIS